jgi:hypothetical protein
LSDEDKDIIDEFVDPEDERELEKKHIKKKLEEK